MSSKSKIKVSVNSTVTMHYTVTHLHDKLFVCHNEKRTDRVFDRFPFLIIPNVQQSDRGIYEIIAKTGDVNTRLYFILQVKTSLSATDTPGLGIESLPANRVTKEENGYTRGFTSTIATPCHNASKLCDTSES